MRSASSPPSSASWQYQINFVGEQNHAGTTRMAARKDAGLALAKFCVAIDKRFPESCGLRTVWTTGRITLDPGAPSIIPGAAEMLFQIRDDDPSVVARLEELLRSMADEVSANGPCTVTVDKLRTGAPAMMNAGIQDAIEAASKALAGGRSIRMPSGAGHDAQMLATIMPAGMLFVPSIGRHQSSLDREHRRRRHRHRRPGVCRRLPADTRRLERLQTQLRILAACFARALLRRFTLLSKRAQGRPGAGWHPRSAARKAHAEKPHSSIQV
ncbi:metal-dependent amidase/aminoacylase/carboxypeptidase family protein [Bradyrhizobium sp. GM22.5]